MKRTKKKQNNPKAKLVNRASPARQDPKLEELKAAMRASVPYETPFFINAEVAPADLKAYLEEGIARAKKTVEIAMLNLANLLTQPLTPLEHARIRETAKELSENLVEPVQDRARQFIVDGLLSKGRKVEGDGVIAGREPLQIEENGYVVRMRPYRNTFDPKLFESKMRAKGLNPEMAAQMTVIYKPSPHKINALVEKGILTPEERESMRYKLTWTVERPRTLEEMTKALAAGEQKEEE